MRLFTWSALSTPLVYRYAVLLSLTFALLVSGASSALASPPEQEVYRSPDFNPANGGLQIAMNGYFPITDGRYDRFLYPTAGYTLDKEWYYFEAQTLMPFVIIDAAGGLISYLASGRSTLPFFTGLNRGTETGRVEMLALTGRVSVVREPRFKVDTGLAFNLVWQFAQFDPVITEEEHAELPVARPYGPMDRSVLPYNLAATVGVGLRNTDRTVGANFALRLGNGFTDLAVFNPLIGVDGTVRFRAHPRVGLYASAGLERQRLDYSGYDYRIRGDREMFNLDFAEWITAVTAQAGVVITTTRTQSY